MATTVIYNGVTLRDCETQSFEQSVQFDESGTDVISSRFTIRVASTLVAIHTAPQFGIDTPAGLSAVERMTDINSRLWEPRKDFWLLVDGGVQTKPALRVLVLTAPSWSQPGCRMERWRHTRYRPKLQAP
jgi:hypothetical protein